MMFSFLQCRAWRVSLVVMPSICRYMVQVYQMVPVLLVDSSTLLTGIGVSSFVLGILCFSMKSQSMQEMSVPLLTRAQESIAFRDCPGTRTWMGIHMSSIPGTSTAATVLSREECISVSSLFKNPLRWQQPPSQWLLHCQMICGGSGLPLPF